jgi:hypothetical protein
MSSALEPHQPCTWARLRSFKLDHVDTTAKQFSRKQHKNRTIGMANIFPSKSEYNRIILVLQVNLRVFTSNFLIGL